MTKASAGLFSNERKANMPAATAATTPTAAGKKGPHPTPTGKRKYVRKKPLPNRKGGPGAAGQPPQAAGLGAGGPGGLPATTAGGQSIAGPNALGAAGGMGGVGGGVNGLGAQGGLGAGPGGAAGPKTKRPPVIKANPYYQPKIRILMDAAGTGQDGSTASSTSGSSSHSKHVAKYNPIPGQYMHPVTPSTVAHYCQSLLRISCMHVLQSSGYDGVQANPLKVMTDCLDRYLRLLAESVKQYAELAGRSQVSALDIVDGLADLGVDLADLQEWTAENGVGSVPSTATISNGSSNIKTEEGTTTTTTKAKSGATSAIASTGDSAHTPQGPLLPTWRGPDPSIVLKDVLYKGRERDRDGRDEYEWRPLPNNFVMPLTEEEQDEFAYPDNDSDEEETIQTQRQHSFSTTTAAAAEASKPTRRKGPQWDPHLKPEHIPDHMPPFPGAILPGSDGPLDIAEELSEDEQEKAEEAATTTAATTAAAAVQAAQAGAGKDTAGELTETTKDQDATNKEAENPSLSESKQHITNPYTHVVPFFESTLPFSPLYASIPTTTLKSSSATANINGGSTNILGSALSDKSRQLFQDTLHALSDSTSAAPPRSMAEVRRKNSRLANSVARSLDPPSDTLFSGFSQSAGVIDSLFKNSAPLAVMNKFASLGISVQDVLSSSPLTTNNVEFPVGPLDAGVVTSSSSTPQPTSGTIGGSGSGSGGGRGNLPPLGMLRKNSATMGSSPLSIVTNAPSRDELAVRTPQRRKSSLASVTASDPTVVGMSSLDSFPTSQETVAPVSLSRRSSHSKASVDKSLSNHHVLSPLSPPGFVKVEKEEPSFSSGSLAYVLLPSSSVPSQPVSLGSTSSFSGTAAPTAVLSSTTTKPATATPLASTLTSTGPIMSLSSLPTTYGMPDRTGSVLSTVPSTKNTASLSNSSKESKRQQQQQQQQQPPAPSAPPPPPPPLQSPTSTGAPKIRFKFSALESLPSDHDDGGSHGSSSSSVHKKERKHHKHSKHHREHHREGSVESSSSSHRKKRKSEYDEYGSDGGGGGGGEGDDSVVRDKKKKKKKHKSKDRDYDRDEKYYREAERERERDHHRHRDSSKSNGYDHDYDYGYGSSSSYGHRKTSSMSSAHGGSSTPLRASGTTAPSTASTSAAAAHGASSAAQPLLPQYLPGQQAALKQQYMQMVLTGPRDDSINCVCKNPQLDDGLFMVACDKCDDWFHGHCVDVRDGDVQGTWYCPRCQKKGYRA